MTLVPLRSFLQVVTLEEWTVKQVEYKRSVAAADD